MTVRKLSSHVRSQLQSGLTITDATQCILELVENSLDAKATAIAVRVNLREFSIEVVDNGLGISSHDLKFTGKRYMTSKCHDFDDLNNSFITYGYKGQALASIAEISGKLIIKTKYKMNKETMIKIFKNGEPPSLFVSSKDRTDKGTTVSVHGFMCTMPVRRKRIFEVFDLQDIKNQMEYLAIIHNEVCFTLRDENKGQILLQTHKKTDPGLSLRDLFGFASDKFFKPFNYREKNIEVQGYISLRRHSESNLKFLYVNNRIVLKSMVHKLVDRCIDKYFKENDNELQEMPEYEGINLNLPKNAYNVYIVKIFCPYTYFVMFRNLRKTTVEFKDWDVILTCIKRAIKSALYFKSVVPESDKVVKIAVDPKRFASRNEQDVGKLKSGIKGGLVKRKLHCGNEEQGILNENSRHSAEGFEVTRNDFAGYNTLSKSELENSSESPNECSEDPKIFSEASIPRENHLNEKENSVLSGLMETVRVEKLPSMGCKDFLDFLAWFQCKLKDDSKIYSDFLKYKNDFRKLKISTSSSEVKRKCIKNKSLATKSKSKYKVVRKRKEEENKKKQIKRSALLRKSEKTRNPVVVKQLKNDKMKRFKGTKRNNCAQHSSELTSKKLKIAGKVGNNSSEDLELPEIPNSPPNALSGCWFSHQNRFNLLSQFDDIETRNSRLLELNVDESKKKPHLVMKNTKLKLKDETHDQNNIGKDAVNSKGTNLEYKDFGVQTDKDFLITSSNDKPDTIHCSSPNFLSTEFQCETVPWSFKNKELIRSTSFDVISKKACYKSKVFSSSLPSLQLAIPLRLERKSTETISTNDINEICEETSNKFSNTKASEELINYPNKSCGSRSTSFGCESQLKLVHTDPLNYANVNSGNGDVSLGRWSDHSKFSFTERYNFIPKGLSQSALSRSPVKDFKNDRQDSDLVLSAPPVNAFNRSKGSDCNSVLPSNILGELQEKTDENMIYYEKKLITANLKINEAEILSLGSVTIDKEELSNITVVGQWDKKFILATVDVVSSKKKKFLTIFDQHAVDERILLEKLLKEFRTSDGHFVSVCYDPPFKCAVKESVGRLIPSFENKLVDYGIKVSVEDHENVLLHEIPLCFANDSILEKAESFFQSLLNNLVKELNETRGAGAAIPKVYYDVISTKACKNAVKFNDVLSDSAMKKMMNDLVACQIPFQCAHGRPCILPILDIKDYKRKFMQEESRLNLRKFSSKIIPN